MERGNSDIQVGNYESNPTQSWLGNVILALKYTFTQQLSLDRFHDSRGNIARDSKHVQAAFSETAQRDRDRANTSQPKTILLLKKLEACDTRLITSFTYHHEKTLSHALKCAFRVMYKI